MDKRLEFDAIVCGEMKKKTTKEWTEIFENSVVNKSTYFDSPKLTLPCAAY